MIIFLDDYHTRLGNSIRIRQQLATFVSRLTSHDLVALMYPLSAAIGATFTRDHQGTAAAIMQFSGRKYDYHPLPGNAYEESFANRPPEVQEQIRNELVIGTMKSSCALMATLREGPKTILFVSEGLPGNPIDQSMRMRDVYTMCGRGNTSVYPLDPRGLATALEAKPTSTDQEKAS